MVSMKKVFLTWIYSEMVYEYYIDLLKGNYEIPLDMFSEVFLRRVDYP